MESQSVRNSKTIHRTSHLRAALIPRLNDYMQRSGLSQGDLAHRIGYARSTVNLFMSDSYHHVAGSCKNICNSIERFMHENPIEPPQQIFGELYDTENVDVIRETVELLLPRPMAYMIYGPPGSEKSFVLEYAIAQLNRNEAAKNGHGRRAYYFYAPLNITVKQLWQQIATVCGSLAVGDQPRISRNMAFDFRTRRVLLVIDEAQHLSNDCLDSIRELLDRPPHFSLLFAGSHDLKLRLDRCSAVLGQLNSRIIQKVMLPGVSREKAAGIVRRELGDKPDSHIDVLLDGATEKDAFNSGKPYINIRTLCNSLERYKQRKARRAS